MSRTEKLNNRRFMWLTIGGFVLVAGLIALWVYGNVQDYNTKGKGNGADPNAVGNVDVDIHGVSEEYVSYNHQIHGSKEISANLFDDREIDDEAVQHVIHEMSHQKVGAEEKWGAMLITQKRLEVLGKTIEQNKGNLKFYEDYVEIVNRWLNNDFSHAVADHNTVWSMQGGTVGKAHSLLDFEQEKQFIDFHFEEELRIWEKESNKAK